MAECGGSGEGPTVPTTTAMMPLTTRIASSPPATELGLQIPERLAELEMATIRVDGVELLVAIARTGGERSRGLTGIDDLGLLDGMLFVWDRDSTSIFWMLDTLIPLDIAWFDHVGTFVSSTTMTPCEPETQCRWYAADGPYRFALEVPAGELFRFGANPSLDVSRAVRAKPG